MRATEERSQNLSFWINLVTTDSCWELKLHFVSLGTFARVTGNEDYSDALSAINNDNILLPTPYDPMEIAIILIVAFWIF